MQQNTRISPSTVRPTSHEENIKQQLRNVGVSRVGMRRPDSNYLHKIIHLDEQIGGVVYGWSNVGSPMIVATDRRIIVLDKMPFFINMDEISYATVSGVKYSHAGPSSIVTLHTPIKDYALRTFNRRSAQNFIDYIERRDIENNSKGVWSNDKANKKRFL